MDAQLLTYLFVGINPFLKRRVDFLLVSLFFSLFSLKINQDLYTLDDNNY